MSKISIKDFGPIIAGYTDENGWMDLKKVSVFIGNQGAGKSTVAKLISTFSWIEKALVRGSVKEKDVIRDGQFKNYCDYQNIGEYFKADTEIKYHGDAYHMQFKNGGLSASKSDSKNYAFPKIMYVPAERNFISAVRTIKNLKGLPSTLYTFSDEYVKAVEDLKGSLDLPINNVRFEYQRLNELASIVGKDYKIRLSNASSGFQSLVPLFIVTKYLTESLFNESSNSYREISIEEQNRIRNEIESILNNPHLSENVKQASLEVLSTRYKYASFFNIVEEPEQNLYPISQRKMLNSLLSFNNAAPANRLLLTTHSPYLINYLTIAVKAGLIRSELSDNQQSELDGIVPFDSALGQDDLVIFELSEDGVIKKLESYKGLPSDENKLNEELGEANEMYARLLDI